MTPQELAALHRYGNGNGNSNSNRKSNGLGNLSDSGSSYRGTAPTTTDKPTPATTTDATPAPDNRRRQRDNGRTRAVPYHFHDSVDYEKLAEVCVCACFVVLCCENHQKQRCSIWEPFSRSPLIDKYIVLRRMVTAMNTNTQTQISSVLCASGGGYHPKAPTRAKHEPKASSPPPTPTPKPKTTTTTTAPTLSPSFTFARIPPHAGSRSSPTAPRRGTG